jgi:hypothetical protein
VAGREILSVPGDEVGVVVGEFVGAVVGCKVGVGDEVGPDASWVNEELGLQACWI